MIQSPKTNLTENFNAINALEWNNSGLGSLPGSNLNLKFKVNEFNVLELVNDDVSKPKKSTKFNEFNQQDKLIIKLPHDKRNKNQQENKMIHLNDRFKQCKACNVIKYKSVFYKKGVFCSQVCALKRQSKGKKINKKKSTKQIKKSTNQQIDKSSTISSSKNQNKKQSIKSTLNDNAKLNLNSIINSSKNEKNTTIERASPVVNKMINKKNVQLDRSINVQKQKNQQSISQTKSNSLLVDDKKDTQAEIKIKTSIKKTTTKDAACTIRRRSLKIQNQLNQINNVQTKVTIKSNSNQIKSTNTKLKKQSIKSKSTSHSIDNSINNSINDSIENSMTNSTVNSTDNLSNNIDYKSIDDEQDLIRQLNLFLDALNPVEIVQDWNCDRVTDFVSILPECSEYAIKFKEQNVDGESFLLLTLNDLINILEIKLYAALKIYHTIRQIRKNLIRVHNSI